MKSKKTQTDSQDHLEVEVFVPVKTQTAEEQQELNKLLYEHPSKRKYLSNRAYSTKFAGDKDAADDLIAHAKANKWAASYDKKERLVTVKIPKDEIVHRKGLEGGKEPLYRFLNNQGDINLNYSESAKAEDVLKKGFIKNNEEKRADGNRNPIPLQNSDHGHSAIEIATAYNFPEGDGEGQTIGIIELGGKYEQSDLEAYFEAYGLEVPEIQVVGEPSKTPMNENVEVTADIQVAGSLAPKAKLVIYYGTSILNAMKAALSDAKNKLTVISISWAGSELNYSQMEIEELNKVFYEASLKGITVIGASGDSGAYNNKQYANVNVPVNFPFVMGCGGTTLLMQDNHIASEVVWNESQQNAQIGTGGGFSQRVLEPSYQQIASQSYLARFPQFRPYHQTNGRSIPDIAANAADASGYSIYFEGKWVKIGGTSLATPLWAALIARINQELGYQLGFINPFLYRLMNSNVFHPITQGNNNLYLGATGWNPCTGLGTPNGKNLMEAIRSMEEE